MRNCYKEEEISRYLDGELDLREASLIEEHLKSCPECKAHARRIQDTGIVLKAYWQKAVAPSLAKGPDCPEEGVLLAFADGSIRGEDERKEIASHLAGCDSCGRIVAEVSRAVDLASAAAEVTPSPVPARLNRMIEQRFFSSELVSIGRINVNLSDIRDSFSSHLNSPRIAYPLAPSFQRTAMVAEIPEIFPERPPSDFSHAGEEPRDMDAPGNIRKHALVDSSSPEEGATQRAAANKLFCGKENPPRGLRWVFDRGEIHVAVEMAVSGMKDIECRINLTDCYGFPLAGVFLRLEKDGKNVWSHHTGLNNQAIFPHVTPGNYRLTIDHDRDYYLDLDVR